MRLPWKAKPPVEPAEDDKPQHKRRGFFHAYFEGRRERSALQSIAERKERALVLVDSRVQKVVDLCPKPDLPAVTGAGMDASESGQSSLAKIGMIGNRWAMSDILYAWYGSHTFIGHQACAFLAQHWLINKACSIPGRDAVRNWFEITSANGEKIDADRIKQIDRLNKRYKLKHNLTEFVRHGRIFGVRVLLFKVDPGNVPLDEYYAQPFNIDAVKPGSYKGLVQIDPYWCNPFLDTDEALRPDSLHFYEPTWWIIGGRKVHRTHLAIFRNAEVPDILKPAYLYGGVPVPQLIMERVYAAERTANEMPLLATSKRQTVLKTDVARAFANKDEFDANLQSWIDYRDNFQVKVCDSESEDIVQLDTSLTDLDEVVMTSYQLVAASSDVPVTKLLGTSPKGFNATGEYDEANYHETLESIQEHDLTPIVDRHHQLMCRSEGLDLDLAIEWNPLDSPTAEEAANVQKTNAERDNTLVQIGAIDQYDVRDRLIQDNGSGYTWLEMVERPEEIDLEPEPPPAAPFQGGPGAGGHEGGEPPETGSGGEGKGESHAMDIKDVHGQEHAPSGSSKGGQFVSQGGGGGSSAENPKSKAQLKIEEQNKKYRERLAAKLAKQEAAKKEKEAAKKAAAEAPANQHKEEPDKKEENNKIASQKQQEKQEQAAREQLQKQPESGTIKEEKGSQQQAASKFGKAESFAPTKANTKEFEWDWVKIAKEPHTEIKTIKVDGKPAGLVALKQSPQDKKEGSLEILNLQRAGLKEGGGTLTGGEEKTKGVGGALIAHAVKEAAARGAGAIYLHPGSRVRDYYKGKGFADYGTVMVLEGAAFKKYLEG